MGSPAEVEIGDNLVFSVNTHEPDTGAATDADAVPAYRVYEDETGTAILTGNMAKLDDANTTGFYSESIACTSGNGFENGKSYTVYISAAVSSTTGTISFGFKAYDQRKADAIQISGDATSADNLELQYDTTGLTGDTFPANQSQINQIANVSGIAKRAPSNYELTTGVQSANTVSSTEELDGTRHEHTDDGGVMDLYYQFDVGAGIATEVKVTGYLQGNNDDLEVYGYDWVSVGWKRIGTFAGQASANNVVNSYDLLVDMVGSGANEGVVRVRFTDGAFTLSSAVLAIDQILVEFAQGIEGYESGAVWLDTNRSNTNTVRGIDGTSTNPVSTIAAVNTLLASTNLARIQVAPNSSFTLAASQENQKFIGDNWTLALGGQSISGSYFEGADISGIGTGASEIHFDHCHFGAITLPPCDCENCVFESTFTVGTAGNFFFENCKSGVAGSSTWIFDYGALLNSSNLNMRDYSGGVHVHNMGAGTGTYNMSLEGNGQLIINANCSATSTIAMRGNFTVTDNAGGAVTLSDNARWDVDQERGTNGANTTVPDAAGTAAALHATTDGKIDTVDGKTDTIAGDVAGLDGDPMRGTDGANTVVPDIAGAAATLHAATDALINALNDPSLAEIKQQVEDVLLNDAHSELSAIPGVNASMGDKLELIAMMARNGGKSTPILFTTDKNDGTPLGTAAQSDVANVFTRGKLS